MVEKPKCQLFLVFLFIGLLLILLFIILLVVAILKLWNTITLCLYLDIGILMLQRRKRNVWVASVVLLGVGATISYQYIIVNNESVDRKPLLLLSLL